MYEVVENVKLNDRVEVMPVAEDSYTRYVCPNCGATVAKDKADIPDRCHHCGVAFAREDVKETFDKESLCHEILDYYIKINGFECRNVEGKPTMFIDFSGHVNTLFVRVFLTGWSSDVDWDNPEINKKFEFCFDEEDWRKEQFNDNVVAFRILADSLIAKMEAENV